MNRTILSLVCAGAVCLGAIATPAHAQSPDKKSVYFTFNQPVTLPQMTLPAGRYLFQLADSQVNRTIVQVYSADRSKLYGMMMTVSARRTEAPNDAEVRFMETAGAEPHAIATWWYPGDKTGWEFIYPREQAMTLAKTAVRPVLTTTADASTTDAMRTAELARIDRTGQASAASTDEVATVSTGDMARGEVAVVNDDASASARASASTAPMATATTAVQDPAMASAPRQTAPRTAPAAAVDAANTRTELPSTASPLPTLGVMGLIALAAAGLLRLRRSAA